MATTCQDARDGNIDNFKDIYKRFKRRDRPLSVHGVIDFSSLSSDCLLEVIFQGKLSKPEPRDFLKFLS